MIALPHITPHQLLLAAYFLGCGLIYVLCFFLIVAALKRGSRPDA